MCVRELTTVERSLTAASWSRMATSPFRPIGQPLPRRPVRTFLSAALLGVSLILGGGGANFPATMLVVQCTALVVLVYMLAEYRRDRAGLFDWLALGLMLLVLLLPLLQLVPLPATMWQALPGRGFLVEAAGFTGTAGDARPLSLIPDKTFSAWLTLIVPVTMFIATLQADGREIRLLLWVVVGAAVAGALLAMVQAVYGDSEAVYLYITSQQGLPTGVFGNRNHQATLMVLALLVAWLLARDRRRKGRALAMRWGLFGLMGLFAAAALATASRTGSVLLLIALVAVFAPEVVQRNRRSALIGGAIAGLTVITIGVLLQTGAFQRLMGRFALQDDNRYSFWPDVVFGAQSAWPAGTGFGTFDPYFRSIESLDSLGSHYINHAHNDYLELALEGGLPAIMLLLLFAAFLVIAAWRLLRRPQPGPEGARGGIALVGIILVLLHSLVDYPLRTFAVAALFALLCGLLVRALRQGTIAEEDEMA